MSIPMDRSYLSLIPRDVDSLLAPLVANDPAYKTSELVQQLQAPGLERLTQGNYLQDSMKERSRYLYTTRFSTNLFFAGRYRTFTGEIDWERAYNAATELMNETYDMREYFHKLSLQPNIIYGEESNNSSSFYHINYTIAIIYNFDVMARTLESQFLHDLQVFTNEILRSLYTLKHLINFCCHPRQNYHTFSDHVVEAIMVILMTPNNIMSGNTDTVETPLLVSLNIEILQVLYYHAFYLLDSVYYQQVVDYVRSKNPAVVTTSKVALFNTFVPDYIRFPINALVYDDDVVSFQAQFGANAEQAAKRYHDVIIYYDCVQLFTTYFLNDTRVYDFSELSNALKIRRVIGATRITPITVASITAGAYQRGNIVIDIEYASDILPFIDMSGDLADVFSFIDATYNSILPIHYGLVYYNWPLDHRLSIKEIELLFNDKLNYTLFRTVFPVERMLDPQFQPFAALVFKTYCGKRMREFETYGPYLIYCYYCYLLKRISPVIYLENIITDSPNVTLVDVPNDTYVKRDITFTTLSYARLFITHNYANTNSETVIRLNDDQQQEGPFYYYIPAYTTSTFNSTVQSVLVDAVIDYPIGDVEWLLKQFTAMVV